MPHSNNNEGIGEEIVCSTGELMGLKCLSYSAVEMRALQQNQDFLQEQARSPGGARRSSLFHFSGNNNYANQQHQRSHSFDTSIEKKTPTAKSNLLSGILNRIKIGVGVNSSSDNEVTDESNIPESTQAPPTSPVLSTAVLIADPNGCGPVITTISPTPEPTPGERTPINVGDANASIKKGIPWDNNTGYFLDASVLGLAIENHLKNGDNGKKRRATFCTLSTTNSQLLQSSGSTQQDLGQQNRPRSASAYSVIPFSHASGSGHSTDPEQINRRRESIASTFPSRISGQIRRNSSFTPTGSGGDPSSPDYYAGGGTGYEEVIVGSFIKTSMTSELYSEGEVIVEEEQTDIEDYDKQIPQNLKDLKRSQEKRDSSSSIFSGIDFKKPKETIINLFASASDLGKNNNSYGCSSNSGFSRFNFISSSTQRVSVTTIDEEDEEGPGQQPPRPINAICGFFRNVFLQIMNSFFRS